MTDNSRAKLGFGLLALLQVIAIWLKVIGGLDIPWVVALIPLLAVVLLFILAVCVAIILKVTE